MPGLRSADGQLYSNSGETFIVLRNGTSVLLNPSFSGLSWAGPAFIWVLGTSRSEDLARLLDPLTLLHSRRGYQAPVV